MSHSPLIDAAQLRARVVQANGNPECFHCCLSVLVDAFAQSQAQGAPEVLRSLMELAGDMLGHVRDEPGRLRIYAEAVKIMGTRCHIEAGAQRRSVREKLN